MKNLLSLLFLSFISTSTVAAADFEPTMTITEDTVGTLKCEDVSLGEIGAWKEVLRLKPGSAFKLEAYTSENNYIQPWVIYAWKAYEFQNASMHIIPLAKLDEHSRAVEWSVEPAGVMRIKKTKYTTLRVMRITSLQVLRGPGVELYVPCKLKA